MRWLARRSSATSLLFGYLLVVAVGILDYLTGYQFGCSVFYLLPVLLVSWKAGRAHGMAIALVAALVWLGADLMHAERYRHVLLPYWNAGVRWGVFSIQAYLVSAFRDERSSARTDPLTGLANRHAFLETAHREVARARRYRRPLTVAFIDCDRFKEINDQRGHAAGDRYLKDLAAFLGGRVRDLDLVARLGGDEFAILMPETDGDDLAAFLKNLRADFEAAGGAGPAATTFSLGAVTWKDSPPQVDEILLASDQLMYAAKGEGHGTWKQEIREGPPLPPR